MESPIVLGLDFGGSKIAAAIADVDGRTLGTHRLAVRGADSAAETFARGVALARGLLAGRPVAALGACTFGIPHDDRVELAPNVPGWERLAFGAELHRAFPGAVIRTATDVKAAAAAEVENGALTGCDPGLYLNLGTGLAVALVIGGVVVDGRHRAAGEIGYQLGKVGDAAAASRLEERVSGAALETAATELLGGPDVAGLFGRADTLPAAAGVRDRFLDELCFHLVNLTIAVDPERVVVGGGLVRSWAHIGPRLADALASCVPFPPDLVLAAHPYDAPLLGALALGRAALTDLPSTRDVISEGAPA